MSCSQQPVLNHHIKWQYALWGSLQFTSAYAAESFSIVMHTPRITQKKTLVVFASETRVHFFIKQAG